VSNELYATKSFFTITNVQRSDAGNYRAVVKNVVNPVPGIGSALFQLTVLADFDEDGLPDAYEQALNLNTNNAADAPQDSDQDGLSNLAEYRSGTDLLDAASHLWVDAGVSNGIATLWFPASSNKTYTVEYSDDLATGLWLKLDDLVARATNHVRVLSDPRPASQRIYRVVTPRRP
jgi:hypothetical protein